MIPRYDLWGFFKVGPWDPLRSDLRNPILFAYPRIARLLDSVIPDVNMISLDLHPSSLATLVRESSSERLASTPSSCMELGFPIIFSASRIARTDAEETGVALA